MWFPRRGVPTLLRSTIGETIWVSLGGNPSGRLLRMPLPLSWEEATTIGDKCPKYYSNRLCISDLISPRTSSQSFFKWLSNLVSHCDKSIWSWTTFCCKWPTYFWSLVVTPLPAMNNWVALILLIRLNVKNKRKGEYRKGRKEKREETKFKLSSKLCIINHHFY